MEKKITHIIHARIFDGERVLENSSLTIEGGVITHIGGGVPENAEILDAQGCTLLPGLIDAHVHGNVEDRKVALAFGVTTVFVMQGYATKEQRKEQSERRDIADALTSLFAVTAPDGHPHEIIPPGKVPKMPPNFDMSEVIKYASTPEEAVRVVEKRVEQGADYIKIMVDNGSVFKHPGLPNVSNEVIKATCEAAHRNQKMALAHAMSVEDTRRAIEGGVDGLMHIFIDQPHSQEMVTLIKNSGAFVCPTLVAGASVIGDSDAVAFGEDERVKSRLSDEWLEALGHHIATYPQGKTETLLATVKALHEAGVDILAGTDFSIPAVGGMAPGASLHHELQMLVKAGLTEIEVLRSATSLSAHRFGLKDRGRIAEGLRADLLLVEGDPTKHIADTLSTRAVWRQGVRLEN